MQYKSTTEAYLNIIVRVLLLSSLLTFSSSFHIIHQYPNHNIKTCSFPTKATSISTRTAISMKLPIEKLTNHANSFAAANGIQVQVKQSIDTLTSNASASYQCAPISLLPNAFPNSAFQNAKTLAPDFNLLVDRISKDGEFFHNTLGGEHGVISKDEYTKKLLELYTDIYMVHGKDDAKPNFAMEADVLGIQRSDYMLNPTDDGYGLKQVELNTIAASFAGLSVNVANLHKMLTERFDIELKVRLSSQLFILIMRWIDPNPHSKYSLTFLVNLGMDRDEPGGCHGIRLCSIP